MDNGRVRGGHAADMTDAAYTAWAADEHTGRTSLLIADTNTAVADLNTRARADRIAWGLVEPDGHRLHDGTHAGVGDRIVTRRIDRTLRTGPNSWVKNGDQWIVAARFDDGSLAIHRATDTHRPKVLTLPAAYVRDHIELGYATTVHRAQGDTVDTAHALIRTHTTRESLYVAMTRGRHANTAYVCTDNGHDGEHGPVPELTVTDVLDQVLARTGADRSAHDTLRAERERVETIAQLAAEYDTIAREARHQRWTALTAAALPGTSLEQATTSPAWPSLAAALRHAETAGLNLDTTLPQLAPGPLTDADPIAVLRDRVQRWYDTATPGTRPTRPLIAGLIPAADDVTDPGMRRALAERAALIEHRAEALVTRALDNHEPWISHLGPPPDYPDRRLHWERAAATVAAYRDRHDVTHPRRPLGDSPIDGDWTRRADRRRAQKAVTEARRLTIGNTADERGQPRGPRHTRIEPSPSRDV